MTPPRPLRPAEPIVHIDMDAFYAAVETQRDPDLAGRPVLVGGPGGRGVVASASYEARRFGVASAMPMARALRLCPDAVVVRPHFDHYERVSERFRAILLSVTPLVEPIALDEAFCDVGGSVRLVGPPPVIGAELRRRVRDELGLDASVGVAPNKFLAKLCSAKAKPGTGDGLLHLRAEEVGDFLARLAVSDLWGVGERTAARLEQFAVRTVGDLRAVPHGTLTRLLGRSAAEHLRALASGEDPRPVIPYAPPKGMSAEETFDRDVDDLDVLRRELLRLAEKVGRRLRRDGFAGRTVTLKLRYANFETVTRSRTLLIPTDRATDLLREAAALLESLRLERVRVRLVGLGVTNLVPAGVSRQLGLLEDDRWGRVEHAADDARRRFGEAAITRGALVDEDGQGLRTGDGGATADQWRGRPSGPGTHGTGPR